jgi:hypothetical protein
MKRVTLIFLVAALVAIGSFGASYLMGRNCCKVGKPGSEMEWLRQTFQLSDSQFGAIKVLQDSYQPTCGRLCQRIATADGNLDRLIQSNQSVTPEVDAALKESSAVREDCRKAMLGQIYRIAAEMSPASRDRYLKMMKQTIVLPTMGHPAAPVQGMQPAHCSE